MEAIHDLYDALQQCDYVLIGAGAGLSAAAGISFANEAVFRRDYSALWAQGVHSDYQTFSYKGWLPGQRWGYLARHIKQVLLDTPALPLYGELKALLEGLNYFVITSNVDHQFIKAGFPTERVFEAQGTYGQLVCSAGCCDEEWDIAPFIARTLPHIADDLTVAEEWLPHCPRCGAPLRPAFRDTRAHAEGDRRYHDFLAASEHCYRGVRRGLQQRRRHPRAVRAHHRRARQGTVLPRHGGLRRQRHRDRLSRDPQAHRQQIALHQPRRRRGDSRAAGDEAAVNNNRAKSFAGLAIFLQYFYILQGIGLTARPFHDNF